VNNVGAATGHVACKALPQSGWKDAQEVFSSLEVPTLRSSLACVRDLADPDGSTGRQCTWTAGDAERQHRLSSEVAGCTETVAAHAAACGGRPAESSSRVQESVVGCVTFRTTERRCDRHEMCRMRHRRQAEVSPQNVDCSGRPTMRGGPRADHRIVLADRQA